MTAYKAPRRPLESPRLVLKQVKHK
jgi:hypothetical protein